MKNLLIASGLLLVIMIGVILWVFKLTSDLHQVQEEIKSTYAERCEELKALDTRFAWKPRADLDAARFPAYVDVRRKLAHERQRQISNPKKGTITTRRRRNKVLLVLRESLEAQQMSLLEFRATGARWQAVMAQDGPFDLRKAWNGIAEEYNASMKDMDAGGGKPPTLVLPAPAKDASKAEKELVRKHAPDLIETIQVDLLAPMLDEIAK